MGRVSIHALIGKILQLIEHDSDGLSLGIQVTGSIIEIKADLAGGRESRTGRSRTARSGAGAATLDPSEYPTAIKEALAPGKPMNMKKLARKIARNLPKMAIRASLDWLLEQGVLRKDVRGYRLSDGSAPATRRRGRPPKSQANDERAEAANENAVPATKPASETVAQAEPARRVSPPASARKRPAAKKPAKKAVKRFGGFKATGKKPAKKAAPPTRLEASTGQEQGDTAVRESDPPEVPSTDEDRDPAIAQE